MCLLGHYENIYLKKGIKNNWIKFLNQVITKCAILGMCVFQELQRRLDQTLGKPGSYHHGVDREGHIKPMTIGARLYRLENQVGSRMYLADQVRLGSVPTT